MFLRPNSAVLSAVLASLSSLWRVSLFDQKNIGKLSAWLQKIARVEKGKRRKKEDEGRGRARRETEKRAQGEGERELSHLLLSSLPPPLILSNHTFESLAC